MAVITAVALFVVRVIVGERNIVVGGFLTKI
jgi:hypothetical protein